jgi:hypothetical protein
MVTLILVLTVGKGSKLSEVSCPRGSGLPSSCSGSQECDPSVLEILSAGIAPTPCGACEPDWSCIANIISQVGEETIEELGLNQKGFGATCVGCGAALAAVPFSVAAAPAAAVNCVSCAAWALQLYCDGQINPNIQCCPCTGRTVTEASLQELSNARKFLENVIEDVISVPENACSGCDGFCIKEADACINEGCGACPSDQFCVKETGTCVPDVLPFSNSSLRGISAGNTSDADGSD